MVLLMGICDYYIVDNCKFHVQGWCGEATKDLVEACGATYLPLPTYSPELNPSELVFAKLKWLLKHRDPTKDLLECIIDALEQITYEDMVLYYMHCGYFG